MNPANPFFRWRGGIFFVTFLVGFWAPWTRIGGARPGTLWLFLAGAVARAGILPVAEASIAVIAAATLCALLAAALRTWSAAYLGHAIAQDKRMHGERIVTDGPFRRMRNPLYLGLWLHALALSILMPPSGALVALIGVAAEIAVLISVEENFLRAQAGEVYLEYLRRVPRLLPSLAPRLPASRSIPHWGRAMVGEIYMWGVVAGYALFALRYNVTILEQCVLISLGVAAIVRGVVRPATASGHPSR